MSISQNSNFTQQITHNISTIFRVVITVVALIATIGPSNAQYVQLAKDGDLLPGAKWAKWGMWFSVWQSSGSADSGYSQIGTITLGKDRVNCSSWKQRKFHDGNTWFAKGQNTDHDRGLIEAVACKWPGSNWYDGMPCNSQTNSPAGYCMRFRFLDYDYNKDGRRGHDGDGIKYCTWTTNVQCANPYKDGRPDFYIP